MSNPYIDLANAEEGSVEHLDAVAAIKAREVSAAKAQENVIKGSGRSGHAYAASGITPDKVYTAYDQRSPGMMQQGVSSPDLRDGIIRIGDMETSRDVAEAMRRGMSAEEWTSLTGLPYASLTQNPQLVQDKASEQKAKLQPVQDQLDEMNALDEMAKAEDDAERIAREAELQNVPPSPLETVIDQHLGTDFREKLTRHVIETGDLMPEHLEGMGISSDMLTDTVTHYEAAAEKMLEPVGSCTEYMHGFLTEDEAQLVRAAIVARDLAEVQRLGVVARDRAAAMTYQEAREYLTEDERKQLRLRVVNRVPVIDLPKAGTVSWASAVTNGLISFR